MADFKITIDFIRSVYGNKEFTPLAVPVFAGNEKAYLNECIDTTFVSSVGKFVDRFEEDMAKYTGAKRAVVCVSGTNALHMSLLLAGVKKDDEVLTQALTFIATCNALSYIGAYPVFLDVDKSTMGLSPDAMKEWLQTNAEVRKNTRIAELPESQDFAFREDELACYNKHTGCRIKACVPMTLSVMLFVSRRLQLFVRSGTSNSLRMQQSLLAPPTRGSIPVPSVALVLSPSTATRPSPQVVAV